MDQAGRGLGAAVSMRLCNLGATLTFTRICRHDRAKTYRENRPRTHRDAGHPASGQGHQTRAQVLSAGEEERNRDVAAGMSVVEIANKAYFRKVGEK